jgi:hypothetical protein
MGMLKSGIASSVPNDIIWHQGWLKNAFIAVMGPLGNLAFIGVCAGLY